MKIKTIKEFKEVFNFREHEVDQKKCPKCIHIEKIKGVKGIYCTQFSFRTRPSFVCDIFKVY